MENHCIAFFPEAFAQRSIGVISPSISMTRRNFSGRSLRYLSSCHHQHRWNFVRRGEIAKEVSSSSPHFSNPCPAFREASSASSPSDDWSRRKNKTKEDYTTFSPFVPIGLTLATMLPYSLWDGKHWHSRPRQIGWCEMLRSYPNVSPSSPSSSSSSSVYIPSSRDTPDQISTDPQEGRYRPDYVGQCLQGDTWGGVQYVANKTMEDRFIVHTYDESLSVSLPSPVEQSTLREAAEISTSSAQNPSSAFVVNIFDGHGGWQVAEHARRNLPRHLRSAFKQFGVAKIEQALRKAYTEFDDDLKKLLLVPYARGMGSRDVKMGACALTLVIHPSAIIAASAGDCQAVLSRGGKAILLNPIHSANEEIERKRLKAEHPHEVDVVSCRSTIVRPAQTYTRNRDIFAFYLGRLTEEVPSRCYVKSRLQPTRSLGDFHLKDEQFAMNWDHNKPFLQAPLSYPYITAEPEIRVTQRHPTKDEFIIAGSDGVWDFFEEQECVNLVRKELDKGSTPSEAARKLVDAILERAASSSGQSVKQLQQLPPGERRRYHDDITAVIILLQPQQQDDAAKRK